MALGRSPECARRLARRRRSGRAPPPPRHACGAGRADGLADRASRWSAGWPDRPMPAVGLYAVAMCFIGALVIVDARRAERQVTQLLSIAMVAVGLLLASLLNGSEWFYRAVLLALIFASYAVRQRGLRPGELVLVLTMSLYFAEGSGRHVGEPGLVPVCGRDRRCSASGCGSSCCCPTIRGGRYGTAFRRSTAARLRLSAPWTPDWRLRLLDAGRRQFGRERSGAAPAASQAQPPRDRGPVPGRAGAGRLVEGAAQPTAVGPFQHRTGVGAARRRRQRSVAPCRHSCRDSHAARTQPALRCRKRSIAGSPESMQALAAENAALQTEVRAYASTVRDERRCG